MKQQLTVWEGGKQSGKLKLLWKNRKHRHLLPVTGEESKLTASICYCYLHSSMSYTLLCYKNDFFFYPKWSLCLWEHPMLHILLLFPKQVEFSTRAFYESLDSPQGCPADSRLCDMDLPWREDWLLSYQSPFGPPSGVSLFYHPTSGTFGFPSWTYLSSPLGWFGPFWSLIHLALICLV